MKFSDKLQKIRKENNITQEGLADKLNVSRQAVSKWESGTAYPDTEKLIQISKIFNIKIDDLINDNIDMNKNKDNNKKIDFMEIINQVLEFISKSINMFWSMKFIEKIKCLFEMGILILLILFFSEISTLVIINIIRRILIFLPSIWIYNICSLFETLLLLVWIVIGIIIIIKIFKNRYLDYYIVVNDDSVNERVIEEPIKELKDKKEYKIVIRDPKDSSLHLFKKIEKLFMFFVKCFCLLLGLPLVLGFIFCMIVLVFSLFYILDGIFFNGISILIFGVLLFIYLLLEFIYNLIFNRKHILNRIFIIFIISISLMGIGLGLSFVSISEFSYIDSSYNNKNSYMIEISDNLLLDFIKYNTDNIVIDDSIDNIKIDISSNLLYDVYLYNYMRYNDDRDYNVYDISYRVNELELYKDVLNNLRLKRIVNYDGDVYDIKIYVSSDNLLRLKKNINDYNGYNVFDIE